MIADADARPGDAGLYDLWLRLHRQRPHLRARDGARELGVSEAQLVAARCAAGGEGTALRPAPAPLLAGVPPLGPVMALTRSGDAVLENVGTYGAPDIGEHTGIVIGEGIDLRVFPSGWTYAFALSEPGAAGTVRSLQIFDDAGVAAHKIYLRPESDVAAFDRLASSLASPAPAIAIAPAPDSGGARPAAPDAAVDVAAYRAALQGMQDTHDFFMLLHRFGLQREQGLRLGGPAFAVPLARDAHRALFGRAAQQGIPLMIFVASQGMVQISSGPVPEPTQAGPWFNLIDPRFNLHLSEEGVARAWAVRKATSNGVVTSLELYDAGGTLVVQIFGERHAGESEREDWSAAVRALPAAYGNAN